MNPFEPPAQDDTLTKPKSKEAGESRMAFTRFL
jgi:hypothetical protein